MTKRTRFFWTLLWLCILTPALALAAPSDDFTDGWDRFLQTYMVTTDTGDPFLATAVPYQAIAADPKARQQLERLSRQLAQSRIPAERLSRMSFWLNVYNYTALRAVVEGWPLQSIRDLHWLSSRVWNNIDVKVGSDEYSLAQIEHKIVRPMGDPRVHFALNCASRSCPDLGARAFRPQQLDRQLNTQLRGFLHNPNKGLRLQTDSCELSPIFKWFADDFGDVRAWLRRKAGVIGNKCAALALDYMNYDWSVNTTNQRPVAK